LTRKLGAKMGEDFSEIAHFGPKMQVQKQAKTCLSVKIIERFVGGGIKKYSLPAGAEYPRYATVYNSNSVLF